MDDHQEQVALFTTLTGAPRETALRYLEAMDWDVQGAFEMFTEVEGSAAPSTSEAATSPPPTATSAFPPDFQDFYGAGAGTGDAPGSSNASSAATSRAEPSSSGQEDGPAGDRPQPQSSLTDEGMDQATQDAIAAALAEDDFQSDGAAAAAATAAAVAAAASGDAGLTATTHRFGRSRSRGSSGTQDEIDPETGVRRPTKAYRDTLINDRPFPFAGVIGGGAGGADFSALQSLTSLASSRDVPESEWMFPPPKQLRQARADFQAAKGTAKEEQKWLLVNLQSVDIFDSHRLNRDTWSDDTVQDLISSAFVFWQRSSSCLDGQNYMRLYAVDASELPHIAIIGPTGTKIWTHSGYVAPTELSAQLMEFLDQHSLHSLSAPKAKFRSTLGQDAAPHYDVDGSTGAGEASGGAGEQQSSGGGQTEEEQLLEAAIALSMAQQDAEGEVGGPRTTAEPATVSEHKEPTDAMDAVPSSASAHLPFGESCSAPPPEPQAVAGTTRIQIKMADGTTLVRRCNNDDAVRMLFDVVCSLSPAAATTAFTLQSTYPVVDLKPVAEEGSTLEQAKLLNSRVMMRWC